LRIRTTRAASLDDLPPVACFGRTGISENRAVAAMTRQRFAAATHDWPAARHGAVDLVHDFRVQGLLTNVAWVDRNDLPPSCRHVGLNHVRSLDVGCGTGAAWVALSLREVRAVGIDSSGDVLCLARVRAFFRRRQLLRRALTLLPREPGPSSPDWPWRGR
jgi:SAM-dependent methyltransferase